MTANQPQAPYEEHLTGVRPRNEPRSRPSAACWICGTNSSAREGERAGTGTRADLRAARAGLRGALQPQGLADARPAQRAALARDQDDDEHELPDQPARSGTCISARVSGAGPSSRSASQGATTQARNAHRQRGRRPDAEDLARASTAGIAAAGGGGRGAGGVRGGAEPSSSCAEATVAAPRLSSPEGPDRSPTCGRGGPAWGGVAFARREAALVRPPDRAGSAVGSAGRDPACARTRSRSRSETPAPASRGSGPPPR